MQDDHDQTRFKASHIATGSQAALSSLMNSFRESESVAPQIFDTQGNYQLEAGLFEFKANSTVREAESMRETKLLSQGMQVASRSDLTSYIARKFDDEKESFGQQYRVDKVTPSYPERPNVSEKLKN